MKRMYLITILLILVFSNIAHSEKTVPYGNSYHHVAETNSFHAVLYGKSDFTIQTIVCEPWSSWTLIDTYCTATCDCSNIKPAYIKLYERTQICYQQEDPDSTRRTNTQRYEEVSGCCDSSCIPE